MKDDFSDAFDRAINVSKAFRLLTFLIAGIGVLTLISKIGLAHRIMIVSMSLFLELILCLFEFEITSSLCVKYDENEEGQN